jgi:hypothetical protein
MGGWHIDSLINSDFLLKFIAFSVEQFFPAIPSSQSLF